MKISHLLLLAAPLALAPLVAAEPAAAKGCIKGAIVGGVTGHFAGHGGIGAAAGCAIGRHNANKKDAARQQQNNQTGGVQNANTTGNR